MRGQADAKASQSPGDLSFGVQGNADVNVNEIAGKLAGEVIQGALNMWNGDSSKVTDIMKTATGAADNNMCLTGTLCELCWTHQGLVALHAQSW